MPTRPTSFQADPTRQEEFSSSSAGDIKKRGVGICCRVTLLLVTHLGWLFLHLRSAYFVHLLYLSPNIRLTFISVSVTFFMCLASY